MGQPDIDYTLMELQVGAHTDLHRHRQAQTFLLTPDLLDHTDILSLSGSCRTEMSTTSTSAKWPRMLESARATCGSFIYSVTVTAYALGA